MLKVSESWSARISWKICKKKLSEFVHVYVYVCACTHKCTSTNSGTRREAKCQSSLSTRRESLLFTAVHTGRYTPLSAQGSLCLQIQEHWIQSCINAPGFTPVWRIRIQVLTVARQLLYPRSCFPRLQESTFCHFCVGSRNRFAGLFCFDFYRSPLSRGHTRKRHLVTK